MRQLILNIIEGLASFVVICALIGGFIIFIIGLLIVSLIKWVIDNYPIISLIIVFISLSLLL